MKRREFLMASAAATGAAMMSSMRPSRAFASSEPIKVAQIHDASGGLDIYGLPMIEMLRYAISEINEGGGLLGRPVQLIDYDPQSNIQYYTQYATEAATKEQVDVVFGGITSASREAIRPILRRYGIPYFYATNYEGGVCDLNTFITASTPGQSISKLVPYAVNRWGKKIYVVAADYNFGQISADWVKKFAAENGAEIVATSFFPLDVTDFGAELQKIQAAKPDMVFSILVGGAHLSFYRQWAAAGLNATPIVSSSFGGGNEQILLSPAESRNIHSGYAYFEDVATPANTDFVKRFRDSPFAGKVPYINELGMMTYTAFHLWARAVSKTGTTAHDALIDQLEKGGPFAGPAGSLTIDPKTHHSSLDIYIAEANGPRFKILETYPNQPPTETAAVCDLISNPNDTEQHLISVQ